MIDNYKWEPWCKGSLMFISMVCHHIYIFPVKSSLSTLGVFSTLGWTVSAWEDHWKPGPLIWGDGESSVFCISVLRTVISSFGTETHKQQTFSYDAVMTGGYPGSVGCNNLIPHPKWHLQTAASLSDITRLVDFVLWLELPGNKLIYSEY